MNLGAGALIIEDNKILLLLRNISPEKNKWSIPGGNIELKESPNQAVLREIREETGSNAEIIQYLGCFKYILSQDKFQGLSFIFQLKLKDNVVNREPEIHSKLEWFEIDSLPNNLTQVAKFTLSKLGLVLNNKKKHIISTKELLSDIILVLPFSPKFNDDKPIPLNRCIKSLYCLLNSYNYSVKIFNCTNDEEYIIFCNNLPKLKPIALIIHLYNKISIDWVERTANFVKENLKNTPIWLIGKINNNKINKLMKEQYFDNIISDDEYYKVLELIKIRK